MLVRNKKPIKCAICGVHVNPGAGWAHRDNQGQWHPLCHEHKDAAGTWDLQTAADSARPVKADLIQILRDRGQIIKLQGREYCLFPGLLQLAHENGLQACSTEIIHMDMAAQECAMKGTVTGTRGTYDAHGDSTPANTTKNMRSSFIRLCETRTLARALRLYLGTGLTCVSELPDRGSDD